MDYVNDRKKQMILEDGLTYLNHASIGPLPKKSLEIFNELNIVQAKVGEKKIDYNSIRILWDELRNNVSTLLNGQKDGVTITTNTGSGLHIVADGLQHLLKPGQNIIIPETEFITNSFCWQELAKRHRLEFRTISSNNNRFSLSDWEKIVDDKTAIVALSHVQFGNGFRSNLKEIAKIAHSHGAFIIVDAIQSLGVIPFDIKKNDVDFVAAAGYKWLLGPSGTGLFYSKPEHLDVLESILVGWFSTIDYENLMHNEFKPWKDARKFQQTMINPALNAFNESLKVILDWNINESYNHVIKILDFLISEIIDLDYCKITSSLEPRERSGILSITINDAKDFIEYLRNKNIIVSYRDRGVRISPHAYNSKEEIEKLLIEIKNWEKFLNK
ncbi:MAG: aminotransferase class V-fold PLP-dependent enzyme [Candidatus Hodarchaeales archaeon]|jgi:selenocysteine lyase/cysteine desulfurase